MSGNGGGPITSEALREYSFLTSVCQEEHEAYYPTDGGAYLDRSYFRPSSLEEVRGYWQKTVDLIRRGEAPREIGIYIHWPFCVSRCTFCFCAMSIPAGRLEMRKYSLMLKREMDALRDIFKGIEFSSIYVGGGTPTTMSEDILGSLFKRVRRAFTLAPEAEIYVEASPVTITQQKVKALRRAGVNHVTLGVQTMDEAVLSRVRRRGQTREGVEKAFAALAAEKELLSGIDLIYGLEAQTDRSFLEDFVAVTGMGPHNLRVYAFDPRPQTAFAESNKRVAPALREKQWRMMDALDELARRRGYIPSPLDPEHEDYLTAITRQCRMARKWGASVLGLGASALSHAFGSAWYGHPAMARGAAVDPQGTPHRWEGLPAFYSMDSGVGEEMRGFVVRHLYTLGIMSRRRFTEVFGKDVLKIPALAQSLRELEACGKIRIEGDRVLFPGKDRLERQVFGKHLFSPRLRRVILQGHRSEYKDFCQAHANLEDGGMCPAPKKKIAALMRMYYRPSAPRPSWWGAAMSAENICRAGGSGRRG